MSRLQSLTKLNLGGCVDVGAAGLDSVSRLQSLTSLDLSGCDVDAAG